MKTILKKTDYSTAVEWQRLFAREKASDLWSWEEWLVFVLAVNLGSFGWVFPPGQQSKTILGCDRGARESIPVAHSEIVDVPMWN